MPYITYNNTLLHTMCFRSNQLKMWVTKFGKTVYTCFLLTVTHTYTLHTTLHWQHTYHIPCSNILHKSTHTTHSEHNSYTHYTPWLTWFKHSDWTLVSDWFLELWRLQEQRRDHSVSFSALHWCTIIRLYITRELVTYIDNIVL